MRLYGGQPHSSGGLLEAALLVKALRRRRIWQPCTRCWVKLRPV